MTLDFTTIRAAVLDMDGVLWRGGVPFDGNDAFFAFLQRHGIAFALATNNSTRTLKAYVELLNGLGIPAGPDEIITSAVATADYLTRRYPADTPLYVIGEEGLHTIITERGFPIDPAGARVVVAGMDRQITFEKLTIATRRIFAGADFIGTNPDTTFPMPDGLIPGAGALLAALEAATGVAPRVIGKPEPTMFEVAVERLGTTPATTLMIGDRLETDILGAQRAGLPTALLLTGVTTAEQAQSDPIQATAVFDSLVALREAWAAALES